MTNKVPEEWYQTIERITGYTFDLDTGKLSFKRQLSNKKLLELARTLVVSNEYEPHPDYGIAVQELDGYGDPLLLGNKITVVQGNDQITITSKGYMYAIDFSNL